MVRAGIILLLLSLFDPAGADAPEDHSDLAGRSAAAIRLESPHVERELAVSVLAGIGDAALPAVDSLAADRLIFRRLAAVQVLASQRREPERFLPFLNDPSFTVRAAALQGIRNSAFRLKEIDLILPLLDDPFWSVRRAAVLALTASGHPEAAGPVLAAIGDRDPEIRRAALHFMDDLEADLSADLLRDAAAGLSSAELRRFLISCLPLARPGNEAFFREVVEREGLSPNGLMALNALVATSDRESGLEAVVSRFPRLIALSMVQEGKVADAADTLIGWLGHQAPGSLIRLLESEINANKHPPGQIVYLLVSALGRSSIPVLDRWCRTRIENEEIVSACLNYLDRGTFAEGAEALAAVFPLLEGDLREKAVKQAAIFTGHKEHPALVRLLTKTAINETGEAARTAFGALCRLRDPPEALVDDLGARFRAEVVPRRRGSLATMLADAARGTNLPIVTSILLAEIESTGPAAIEAGAALSRIAEPETVPPAVAGLRSLYALRPGIEDRERILLAMIRLDEPEADAFIAAEVEKQWQEKDSSWVVRLATALGESSGSRTGELLHRMVRDENVLLKKRALQALMMRGDPGCIELLEAAFPAFTSHAQATLLKAIKGSGLESAAAGFIIRIIRTESDFQILTAAIEALSSDRAVDVKPRLMELSAAGFDMGRGAAEEAIRALVRSRDAEAIWQLRQRLSRFLDEARTGQSSFLLGNEENQALALFAAQALAEHRDPETPPLLAGLLFRASRARRKQAILDMWHAETGGPIHIEKHHWAANVMDALLHYPDPIIEKVMLDEIAALEESGDIFKMGDAVFGVLCRGLLQSGRCPELSDLLAQLTFRCRPDMSPAEFRLCVALGDRAAAGKMTAEAARHYRLAYFILKYHPPQRTVVRQELGDSDSFIGYDPRSSMISEALRLESRVLRDQGEGERADRLLEKARCRSPFRRQRE